MEHYRDVLMLILVLLVLAACGTAESPLAAAPTVPVPPSHTSLPIPPSQPPPTIDDTPSPARTIAPTGQGEANIVVPAATAGATSEPILGKPVTAIVHAATIGPAATSGPIVTPTSLRGPNTITMQDNQQILRLAVGDTFVLNLGPPYIWTVQVDERIVARVPGAAAPKDAQGVYKAIAPGQTALVATGIPACANAKPRCLLPDILFELMIIVE
jgi:hypothetical protein